MKVCTSELSIHAGNQADFDHWAQLGNYGWSYADVLPFFKKAEDNRIRGLDRGYSNVVKEQFVMSLMRAICLTIYNAVQHSLTCNNYFSFHGKGGPMPVELIKTRTPSASLFVEACKHVQTEEASVVQRLRRPWVALRHPEHVAEQSRWS